MASRAYHSSQRHADAYTGWFARLTRILILWPLRMLLILLLLIFRRKSIALYLWGKGRIMTNIAKKQKATSEMYATTKWKETRRPIYWRNWHEVGGGSFFVCEVSGEIRSTLAGMHVDHILPRDRWPYLAYDPKNLRLVTKEVNQNKSNKLCGWSLFKFVVFRRIR